MIPVHEHESKSPGLALLERITAAVLLLVVVCVGGMIIASFDVGWGSWIVAEPLVVFVVLLLTAALMLVSVVALLNTR